MKLINFHYPMFSTTDREKEILRMCELELVQITFWTGICYLLFKLHKAGHISWNEYLKLKLKITDTIAPNVFLEDDIYLPGPTHEYRVLLRRIWITKLLNYKEVQQ